MKAELTTGGEALMRFKGRNVLEKIDSCACITLDDGTVIQVHTKGRRWEVWHVPPGPEHPHCIASSSPKPDRHYDE
jgi:hypothetical protein